MNDYNVVLVVMDSLRRDAVSAYAQQPAWGAVATPNLAALAGESVLFTRAYPESLPTLCARRALYTGRRTYPFHDGDFRLKGDFMAAPGWGPIPEEQDTLAEVFSDSGYRTALISDLFHEFKPSKNFWRGFDEWQFIRGQETDPYTSGPQPSVAEVSCYVPEEIQQALGAEFEGQGARFVRQIVMNMRGRDSEESWFNAQVMRAAAQWLHDNRDAERFFLTVECFDPHEPWFVPATYRDLYAAGGAQHQVVSPYAELPHLPESVLAATRANYSALVTMCDRWLGHFVDTLRSTGLLDSTVLVVVSDHGHSLGERRGYIGKRGYPSEPEVLNLALLVRHPEQVGSGTVCDAYVQHHDVAATLLHAAGLAHQHPTDGRSFWTAVTDGMFDGRDHVTVGWGSMLTVVTREWWLNVKINGRGAFLHELVRDDPFAENLAEARPEVVAKLFADAVRDADGRFPRYLLELAENDEDAPGCSPLAALAASGEGGRAAERGVASSTV